MSEDTYVKTFTPKLTISKSDDKSADEKWYISGYASTDAIDTDGEQILPDGIDYSYFEKSGWITYEHVHEAANIIGEPVPNKMHVDSHGLYLEGLLYKDSPKAQEVWNLSKALQKDSMSNRSMGLSVEGKINERDSMNPNIIKSMTLTAVAVTTNPANLEARWQGFTRKSAYEGYVIDPNAMENVSAIRRESLAGGTTKDVANAITTLTYVTSRYNGNDILGEAEKYMRANGTLNKNGLALILQLSEGISHDEAFDFIGRNVKGV